MQITLDIPEQYSSGQSPSEFGRRIKLYAALTMFQSGELSAGAAAEFVEVDRFVFLEECRRRGIPAVSYPADELKADIESLHRAV